MYQAAESRYVGAVRRLLELDANVNLGVSAMSRDNGNTPLHMLVSGIRAGQESQAQLQIVSMLLAHPSTDLCMFNGLGKTPYMSVAFKHKKLLQLLRPAVPWTAIEAVLEMNVNRDALCQALADLVPKVSDLRLPDMLFCEHEGAEEELRRRRLLLWQRLLKPVLLDVCANRELSKVEDKVYKYCWRASGGPPLSMRPGAHNARIVALILRARSDYSDDMDTVLNQVRGWEISYRSLSKACHGYRTS